MTTALDVRRCRLCCKPCKNKNRMHAACYLRYSRAPQPATERVLDALLLIVLSKLSSMVAEILEEDANKDEPQN